MTDLLLARPGELVVGRSPRPATPVEPGEVVVRVERVSLCGSDYRLYDGGYSAPSSYPIRFGHEWAGEVVEASTGGHLRPGTLVTGECSRWCGDCELCQIDLNLCRRIEKFGITVDGFSTRYRTVEARYLHARDGLSLEALALAEIFAVALHGIRRSGMTAGEPGPALVVGAGPLGVAVSLLLTRHYLIGDVHLLETSPERVELVRSLYPGLAVAVPQSVFMPESYEQVGDLARFPFVFECSGATAGLERALLLAARRGRVVSFGLGATPARTDLLVTKGLELYGSIGGSGEFEAVLYFLSRHTEEATKMVTHRFPAEAAPAAFAVTRLDPRRLKVQLAFGGLG